MTDTNDMRRDFEAWYYEIQNVSMRCERLHDLSIRRDAFFATWQSATERATALERERCAVVCETKQVAHTMRGSNTLVDWHIDTPGVHEGMTYAAAIRQGGDK